MGMDSAIPFLSPRHRGLRLWLELVLPLESTDRPAFGRHQEAVCHPAPLASGRFEPKLHPVLSLSRNRLRYERKRRLIFIYGRPRSARNAFELIVEALIIWASTYKNAAQWEVLSAGARHRDVALSRTALRIPLLKDVEACGSSRPRLKIPTWSPRSCS